MAKNNDSIDQLLVANVTEAQKCHFQTHINCKGLQDCFLLNNKLLIYFKKCPQCSALYHTPFPAGVNLQGQHSNEIWQMDVTHIYSFGKSS